LRVWRLCLLRSGRCACTRAFSLLPRETRTYTRWQVQQRTAAALFNPASEHQARGLFILWCAPGVGGGAAHTCGTCVTRSLADGRRLWTGVAPQHADLYAERAAQVRRHRREPATIPCGGRASLRREQRPAVLLEGRRLQHLRRQGLLPCVCDGRVRRQQPDRRRPRVPRHFRAYRTSTARTAAVRANPAPESGTLGTLGTLAAGLVLAW